MSFYIFGDTNEMESLKFISLQNLSYKKEGIVIKKFKQKSKETNLTTYYYWSDTYGFLAFESYNYF